MKALESIIHPEVRQRIDRGIAEAKARGDALIVLDVPLLLDSPQLQACDRLIFVRCSLERRREQVRKRGWDDDELRRREARQTSIELKEQAAQHVIDNDGELEALIAAVDVLHDALTHSQVGGQHG